MSDQPETFEYLDRQRRVAGRVRYPEPPEPGTITGRTAFGERCVVLGTVAGLTLMAVADTTDLGLAVGHEPQSPAEAARDQRETRLRLRHLFGVAR